MHLWAVDWRLSGEIKCVREAIPFEDRGKQRLSNLQLIVKDRQVI
jgi:hypothetical protein